jgi:V8-like Glu-specific endopeptidase
MKNIALSLLLSVMIQEGYSQAPSCNPDANQNRRQQVLNSNPPNTYTCYMEIKRKNRKLMKLSTSFLINPRVILTAGHNLAYWPGEDVDYVNLYFGSIDDSHNLYNTKITLKKNVNRFFRQGYWVHENIKEDFSIIILPDSSIYKKVGGCYQIHPITSAGQISQNIHITGSPGDKPEYQIWNDSTTGYTIVDSSLRYDLYTVERNSGSPIWQFAPAGYQVVGVHSRSYGPCNAAVLINQAVYDQIKAWCKSVGVEF